MEGNIKFYDTQENGTNSKKKKIFIIFIILLPIVAFSIIGYKVFLDLKNQREKVASIAKQQAEEQGKFIQDNHLDLPQGQTSVEGIDKNSPEYIVKDINNKFFAYVQEIDVNSDADNCIQWMRQDGVSFGLKGYESYIKGNRSKDNGVSDQIQKYFIDKGYVKNAINSYDRKDADVLGNGKTVGFENGNKKCTVSWSTANYSGDMFIISCGEVTPDGENNFKTFYDLLNKPQYFCVTDNNNQFASGFSIMSFNRSKPVVGFTDKSKLQEYWYSKKIADTWSMVWKGNDPNPPCSLISDFPKDFYYSKCK